MTAKDAIDLYKLFDQHGIKVWIDGGWGVDALLGHQTRKHDDLDIALHHSNLPALCQLLEDRGYRHLPSGGSWSCNFVLGDDQGHRIDLHSFELDTSGEDFYAEAPSDLSLALHVPPVVVQSANPPPEPLDPE
jgi:lincosamide nucleotidyltransferase A/C/D/E